ncbi:D-alanyl-D-alanine carboxypeptidase family protein [Acaryochloris sp. CCMEE 5410]|uniref:D-alanyl-D-alanine carboxypeptidase family protein n=1 Tax=Acaryochloris sp. CCMEE 5410 TaxID=310037 RepID=UPI0021CE28FA
MTTAVIVWLAASLQLVPVIHLSRRAVTPPSAHLLANIPTIAPATAAPISLYEACPPSRMLPLQLGSSNSAASAPNNYYGHLSYAENEDNRLVNVGEFVRGTYRRSEYLDQEAAAAFTQLVNAAADANLTLQPISGFRSVNDQKELFVNKCKARECRSSHQA